jgi:hypothetical protein
LLFEWSEDLIRFSKFQNEIRDVPQITLCFSDGHTSRISIRLWKKLLENNIQLYIIPSHTSHLLQILDLLPNAVVKENILKIKNIPKQNCSSVEMVEFIRNVEEAVSLSLNKSVIRKAIKKSPIFHKNENNYYSVDENFLQNFPLSI